MLVANTSFNPNVIKYYVLATISFLVAITFHATVYRHFDAMEKGLQEAARIKWNMEFDELEALADYHKSVELHRQGIRDTVLAYEYTDKAYSLREAVFREEKNMQELKEEAKEKEEEAEFDERESAMYGINSFEASRFFVSSTLEGMELARQAEEENERSVELVNKTIEEENEGKERLEEAQAALELAKTIHNGTKIDKGICVWAPVVCRTINIGNGNTTAIASDATIKANRDIQNALAEIHNAEVKRAMAIELHKNASYHANLSTAILHDAQAFKTQSKMYGDDAKEFHSSAAEKEAIAEKDEKEAQLEENDIAIKEVEIQKDRNKSDTLFQQVRVDQLKEKTALEQMNRYMTLVKKRKKEWETKREEATNHVAKAGWEALVASFSGGCLLVVVTTHIFATFRYRQPVRWILRERPYFLQDLLYIVCHILIFLLAIGYVGELLMAFDDHNILARTGITIVFALNAAILQITLLHLIPTSYSLLRESRMESETFRLLAEKVVFKKGVIIAMVSAIEMLLCWCWIGTITFGRAHVLNSSLLWLAVLCMSLWYGIFIQTHKNAVADDLLTNCCDGFDNVIPIIRNECVSGNENERHSLLATSDHESVQASAPSSDNNLSTGSSNQSSLHNAQQVSSSSPSMESVPIGSTEYEDECDYGSLTDIFRAHLSTSPDNFSWKTELLKVRLLFEVLIASVAIWIVRRDLSLIRKLSPLAKDLVWGKAPLWILNILCFTAVATVVISFANVDLGRRNARSL